MKRINREKTRQISIDNLKMGGNNEILIQSMTNTKTKDVNSTVSQILSLEKEGCQIIRVAVLDMEDALALGQIKKQIRIPLVADIHFDGNLAICAIKQGVSKIRLNPGNLKDKSKVKEIVKLCKEHNVAIRIGVNGGSLEKGMETTPQNMILTAKSHIDILEELDFYNVVLSFKCSDIDLTLKTYELASTTWDYPLHIGITESGTLFNGLIKSSIGIASIINLGVGNTIRVSLTDDPIYEVRAAKQILKNLGFSHNTPTLISCPTCGRTSYDMIPIAKEIEKYLNTVNKNIKVAVMGCVVNGPKEASDADIGIAGGINEALLFKKGVPIKKIKQENLLNELIKEIELL